MHSHLEIILPYVPDVETAIDSLMQPFNECDEKNMHAFWDWYEIGGRWSGTKLTATLDPEALDRFNDELNAMPLTVSAVQCGKPELMPDSQAVLVDQLWRRHFPHSKQQQCPFFRHAGSKMPLDIATLGECSMHTEAAHFMIAGTYNPEDTSLHPMTMLINEIWNGVSFQKTVFDGTLQSALDYHNQRFTNTRDEYRKLNTPTEDWLVVTVDYHS